MKNKSISIDFYPASICSALNNIKPHFTSICCLQLHLNTVKLSLEPVLGTCVNHLAPNPSSKGSQPWVAAAAMGHPSNNYSESKRNDHLDNNRHQEQRNK
ncbi:hypothetical protein Tco_0875609, partial [Tanacetum coccineum]